MRTNAKWNEGVKKHRRVAFETSLIASGNQLLFTLKGANAELLLSTDKDKNKQHYNPNT
jgi:hypothetical protein